MELSQSWVGRADRSYEQIKRSLLKRLTQIAPEVTDHSESNILIILLSMFAGIAEVINLYIDSTSKEAFMGTARRYASIVKLSRLIDYDIKARGYATAEIVGMLVDDSGNPTTYTSDIVLAKGTVINSINSEIVPFTLLSDLIIPRNQSSGTVTAAQYTEVINDILGNTISIANQSFAISDKYVHGTMRVLIANEDWYQFNSFGLMDPNTKGFVIEINENGEALLIFGDGVNGKIPTAGQSIFASYWESEGASGNVPPDVLTNITSNFVLPANLNILVTNPDYASGGADFEGLEDIRNRAPRSIRTLDRAVTYQDFIDIALQVVGVGAAEVSYCCGKYVDVYIVPNSRGIATRALLNKVKQYMDARRMITTQVDVKPAGVTRVWIQANIIGMPLVGLQELKTTVLKALDDNFGQGTTKINRRVAVTDIIAVLENLKTVDVAEIQKIKLEPYARPANNTSSKLNIEFVTLPSTTQQYKYSLIYNGERNNFQVYKAGVFITNLELNTNFIDGALINFIIHDGIYQNNDKWDFTVFPSYPEIFPTSLISINDFSAPVIDVSPYISDNLDRTIFGNITYETQQPVSSCLPPC